MRQVKILFLDIDGVLNNHQWYSGQERRAERDSKLAGTKVKWDHTWDIDPENVRWLNEALVAIPDLMIVVSSTWRLGEPVGALKSFLELVGVAEGRVIGKTGIAESRMRYEEILSWLENTERDVDGWVAVDDDTSDMVQLGEGFVWVDSARGFSEEHYEKVVKRLRDE